MAASPAVFAGCSDDDDDGAQTPTAGSGGQGGSGGRGGSGGAGNAGQGPAGSGGAGGGAGASGGAGAGGMSSEKVDVQILAFNDFHGHLEPPPGSGGRVKLPDGTTVDAGGAAYFAHHIGALRATNPNTVVVSAGDLIGASPLISGLFRNEPTIEVMNMIGLDINGVGNHEFDKGTAELLRMKNGGCHPDDDCTAGPPFAGASFNFLAANVVDTAAGTTIFPAYEVREFDGVKVAFIGMTLEGTPSIVTPAGIAGLSFKDEVETVNALVPQIRAQGVEAIVVLIHEGGLPSGSYDACPGISGPIVEIATNMSDAVDVIASGHTHEAYNCTIAGKLVTSAASFGRIVTDIDLQISRATGDVTAKSAKNVIATRETADPEVAGFVAARKSAAAPLANRQVGTITADFSATAPEGGPGLSAMGAFIADSQLAATRAPASGSAVVAFMNPGGVRSDLVYAAGANEAADGVVTFGETFTVQPFGNSLVVMTLTGAQIDALLEQQFQLDASGAPRTNILQVSQGFSYAYSVSAPLGSKIDPSSIRIDGTPIDENATYRVTVNSFLASGGDGFTVLAQGTDRLGGLVDLEALEAYFAANSPASPPALDRITALP